MPDVEGNPIEADVLKITKQIEQLKKLSNATGEDVNERVRELQRDRYEITGA